VFEVRGFNARLMKEAGRGRIFHRIWMCCRQCRSNPGASSGIRFAVQTPASRPSARSRTPILTAVWPALSKDQRGDRLSPVVTPGEAVENALCPVVCRMRQLKNNATTVAAASVTPASHGRRAIKVAHRVKNETSDWFEPIAACKSMEHSFSPRAHYRDAGSHWGP
jgi:hypothetical protein